MNIKNSSWRVTEKTGVLADGQQGNRNFDRMVFAHGHPGGVAGGHAGDGILPDSGQAPGKGAFNHREHMDRREKAGLSCAPSHMREGRETRAILRMPPHAAAFCDMFFLWTRTPGVRLPGERERERERELETEKQ
ncbi:MAG: hypothetical protein JWR26_1963 [Pedosphaera sp.]|nr:hypothetical protein [Pedosphaera sp.]